MGDLGGLHHGLGVFHVVYIERADGHSLAGGQQPVQLLGGDKGHKGLLSVSRSKKCIIQADENHQNVHGLFHRIHVHLAEQMEPQQRTDRRDQQQRRQHTQELTGDAAAGHVHHGFEQGGDEEKALQGAVVLVFIVCHLQKVQHHGRARHIGQAAQQAADAAGHGLAGKALGQADFPFAGQGKGRQQHQHHAQAALEQRVVDGVGGLQAHEGGDQGEAGRYHQQPQIDVPAQPQGIPDVYKRQPPSDPMENL